MLCRPPSRASAQPWARRCRSRSRKLINPCSVPVVSAIMRDGSRYRVQVTSKLSYTAVFEPVEDGWVQARLAELPGVITAAPTQDEAQELLLDALREYLLALVEPSDASAAPVDAHRIDVELRAS